MKHISVEVVEIAREKGLSIVMFHPHCSHLMQPLDVGVYGPLNDTSTRHTTFGCSHIQVRQSPFMMLQN